MWNFILFYSCDSIRFSLNEVFVVDRGYIRKIFLYESFCFMTTNQALYMNRLPIHLALFTNGAKYFPNCYLVWHLCKFIELASIRNLRANISDNYSVMVKIFLLSEWSLKKVYSLTKTWLHSWAARRWGHARACAQLELELLHHWRLATATTGFNRPFFMS